jgi:hypothetical protein
VRSGLTDLSSLVGGIEVSARERISIEETKSLAKDWMAKSFEVVI